MNKPEKTDGTKIDADEDLTGPQRQAVAHVDGPMLVLAGPGSGKTRVITRRVARLIKKGIKPSRILALTFTNKAAEEMRERLRAMRLPRGAVLCTFHSLCVRILREFADRAGLPADFTIYDRSDQTAALREVLKNLDLDPVVHPPLRALQQIGRWKNALLSPEDAVERAGSDPRTGDRARIYAGYAERLRKNAALDFDDLLMRTAVLLRDDEAVRDELNQRFLYIMVDEYQDTNRCQYRIARDLSRLHRNLFVTGDPDQSIYGWRGADINNILDFEKDFPETRIVSLEDNFRSCPQILDLADGIIQANTRRKEKRLIPRCPGGDMPRLYAFGDEFDEAEGVVLWIREMTGTNGVEHGGIALFYRTNAMSRVFEEKLRNAGIPYQIVRGLEFYSRREIKDMLAYLRMIVNPADRVALLRIVNRPTRGLGDTTLSRLIEHGRRSGRDLWTMLTDTGEVASISAAARVRIERFADLVRGFQDLKGRPVAEIVRAVFTGSGLQAALEKEKNEDAIENVEELIHSAQQYDEDVETPDLAEFLQRVALVSDPDAYDAGAGAVSLMTLHAAKGLEFPAVWIAGVEDGLIPHTRMRPSERSDEEERRLLFVGITRAERFLALSYARKRASRGARRESGPSPFLSNLEGLERIGTANPGTQRRGFPLRTQSPLGGSFARGGFRRSGSQPVSFPPSSGDPVPFPETAAGSADEPQDSNPPGGDPFGPGRRVRHPNLGPGRIEQVVSGEGAGRVIVKFESGARLTLDLRFARLEPEKETPG